MMIREATSHDFDAIWPIFHAVASEGNTYAYEIDTSYQQAQQLWMIQPAKTFVAEINGDIVGTYYIKTNQAGPGNHVCNCGYMVAASARGRGIARAMCEHSQAMAKQMGYSAMQFNFVASSNTIAVGLWHKLGFETVGRLPHAFNHPQLGKVDALVMFKNL